MQLSRQTLNLLAAHSPKAEIARRRLNAASKHDSAPIQSVPFYDAKTDQFKIRMVWNEKAQ